MWDVSAFVGVWPFRQLPDAGNQNALEKRLRECGITRAYVSPLEALFHADPMPVNAVWASRLADSDFFRFVPVLNPSLPLDAEQTLAKLRELPGSLAAIRLHPNYHGYSLDSEAVRLLTRKAGEAGLPVIVQVQMQDVRGMHPLVRVPDTDPATVLALASECPETTIVAAGVRWGAAKALAKGAAETSDRLYLEISHMEYVDPIRQFIDQFGTDRLLPGSHAPLLTPAALKMKLDAARLSPNERESIAIGNARKAGFQ
ncbi:MAG: amidohydrolase family protein [Armatimonadota bacterium]